MRPLRLLRSVYTRASEVEALRRPLDVVRKHPRVRALARRHTGLLLAQGSTWSNVDGSLRLLAEDTEQRIVFGPWRGDVLSELLYWVPFVRWAQEHFALDPARLVAASRGGVSHWYAGACSEYVEIPDQTGEPELPGSLRDASVFRPGPVLALVEHYREGTAAPRPLMKRARHLLLDAPHDPALAGLPKRYAVAAFDASDGSTDVVRRLSESGPVVSLDDLAKDVPPSRRLAATHTIVAGAKGVVASDAGLALLAALSGVPAIALRTDDSRVSEPDLDMCLRVVTSLGGSLTVLDTTALLTATAAF